MNEPDGSDKRTSVKGNKSKNRIILSGRSLPIELQMTPEHCFTFLDKKIETLTETANEPRHARVAFNS